VHAPEMLFPEQSAQDRNVIGHIHAHADGNSMGHVKVGSGFNSMAKTVSIVENVTDSSVELVHLYEPLLDEQCGADVRKQHSPIIQQGIVVGREAIKGSGTLDGVDLEDFSDSGVDVLVLKGI
jgi:hypothetical protein